MISTRDEVVAKLREHGEAIAKFGVKHISVFGSTVRGASRPDSDVDILVEFADDAKQKGYFDRFMGLAFYLEEILGRRVDLVTPEMLEGSRGAILRPRIEMDLVRVA